LDDGHRAEARIPQPLSVVTGVSNGRNGLSRDPLQHRTTPRDILDRCPEWLFWRPRLGSIRLPDYTPQQCVTAPGRAVNPFIREISKEGVMKDPNGCEFMQPWNNRSVEVIIVSNMGHNYIEVSLQLG
jgi:hypothetical protein